MGGFIFQAWGRKEHADFLSLPVHFNFLGSGPFEKLMKVTEAPTKAACNFLDS